MTSEKLKQMLEKKKASKTSTQVTTSAKDTLIFTENDFDLSIANLTNDSQINSALRAGMLDYINRTTRTNLWYGKHFQEIFELLGNGLHSNQYTSYYNDYLKLLGVHPKTARRYRKRYSLYKSSKSESLKKLIASISDKDIDFIENNPYILGEIEDNKIETKEDLKKLITSSEIKPNLEGIILPAISFNELTGTIDNIKKRISENQTKINNDSMIQIEKLLRKIDNLLTI